MSTPSFYNNDVRLNIPVLLVAIVLLPLAASAQDVPPPQPFPRPGAGGSTPRPAPPPPSAPVPASPAPPAPIARSAPPSGAPTDQSLGVPGIIYPTAEYLTSYDLGRGQHAYLFGTNLSFTEMVAYYKQVLRDGGRELTKAPAMQQFDLGKFQDDAMAAQPSVLVKDYTFGGGEGYLHVDGTESKRFKTVVQIVPMPGR
jgi:hypothetical protein